MNAFIVGLFFAAMLLMGLVSMKKIRTMASFTVADRRASVFMVTGSLLATIVGGSSTVGLAGLGFSRGLVGAWWLLVGVLGLTFLAIFLAKHVRKTKAFTLPEILERQYGGKAARTAASLLIVIAWLGIIAAQIIAAGKIMSVLWPGQVQALTILAALVFILYTALGGQYSILLTDSVQAVIIAVGLALCLWLGISSVGGWTSFVTSLPREFLSFPLSAEFGWKDLLTFLLFVGTAYLVGPDIYSRILSARNAATARRALFMAALGLVFIAFTVVLIGMVARIHLPDIASESALPALIMAVVPAGLNGLIMAALLAAIMSSADTCLLTAGTIITSDIIGGLCGRKLGEGTMLILTRICVVVVGLSALFIGLKMGGVIASLLLAYTVYSAGLVVPVVLGFYREKLGLNAGGAIIAIVGGGFVGAVMKLSGSGEFLLFSLPFSAALLFAGSYGTRLLAGRRST
ncbi:MAG: sodium:solute symporter family protein [Syntrophales bacterium]|jgi:SSS family solute:Na+ symporter|nr:sodium:solute symporter family protein [Syntrophales bacterium]MCK9528762.1 sodium:solute symporter family protein [Syntrophales bacterium]MDX9922498.1 sodium:solute symporter family protein [Syntrophales bacterium]